MSAASPLARHVAARHTGIAIDFLCRSPTHRIVPFVPVLRAAFVDDTPHGRLGVQEKLRLAARLRAQRYRRVYVVSRTFKSAIVPFLAGIPERVGLVRRGAGGDHQPAAVRDRRLHGETERVCALASPQGTGGMRAASAAAHGGGPSRACPLAVRGAGRWSQRPGARPGARSL